MEKEVFRCVGSIYCWKLALERQPSRQETGLGWLSIDRIFEPLFRGRSGIKEHQRFPDAYPPLLLSLWDSASTLLRHEARSLVFCILAFTINLASSSLHGV